MKKRFVVTLCLLMAVVANAFALSKQFETEQTINVAGNYRFLMANGFSDVVNPLDVAIDVELISKPDDAVCRQLAREMTARGYGEKIVAGLRQKDPAITAEVLERSYIVLTYVQKPKYKHELKDSTKKETPMLYYALFHVETAEAGCPIVTAYYARAKNGNVAANISRHLMALDVKGHFVSLSPAEINLGYTSKVKKGDRIDVYSQNRKVASARVSDVWDNGSRLHFENGILKGDISDYEVVRNPDQPLRLGLKATYMPHVWGLDLALDGKFGISTSGLIHHVIGNLGYAITDHANTYFSLAGHQFDEYRMPQFFNVGVGYGFSKMFCAHWEFMPFIMAQYELGYMKNRVTLDTLFDTEQHESRCGSAFKFPVGIRLGYNVSYPIKVFLETGYAFRTRIGHDADIIDWACDYVGAKRSGLFVNVGILF